MLDCSEFSGHASAIGVDITKKLLAAHGHGDPLASSSEAPSNPQRAQLRGRDRRFNPLSAHCQPIVSAAPSRPKLSLCRSR